MKVIFFSNIEIRNGFKFTMKSFRNEGVLNVVWKSDKLGTW